MKKSNIKIIAIILFVTSAIVAIVENYAAVSYIAKAIMKAPYSVPVIAISVAIGSVLTLIITGILNSFSPKKAKHKNSKSAETSVKPELKVVNGRQSIVDVARQIDMPMDLGGGTK